MLPSRGVLRSLPSARATSSISSQSISRSPRRLGDGRNFGTSLRGSSAPWSLRTSKMGGIAGSVALGGSLQTRRAISLWNKPDQAPSAQTAATPSQSAAAVQPPVAEPAVQPPPVAEPAVQPPVDQPAPVAAPVSHEPTPDSTFPDAIPDLDAASILDLPETIGYLKNLGLDFGWGPSSVMQWCLEHIHVYTGMPWWASITATAVLLRLVLLKPMIKAQTTAAKMQQLQQQPQYLETRQALLKATSEGDSAAMANVRRDLALLNKQAGVNPIAGLWGLLQVPFGYGMFRVLNGAAGIPVPGFETGGFLWLADLSIPDPLYILPIAGPISMFLMLKMGSKYATPQAKAQQKLMMYILGPITLIFTMYLPAAVQWYFLVTGALGVGQNWLLNRPSFRRRMNMPIVAPAPAPTLAGSVASYQAPRRGQHNVTASSASTAPAKSTFETAVEGLRQTMHSAKGGMGNYAEAEKEKKRAAALKEYEERRSSKKGRRH
ncbi:YidC/Oxa1 family membrane protein insertase [Colletotrichum plurivorum]|uniref:YidC/Oxa1 family membrane protein insertase n=1 Tax=Colletotrichum plurivorum TaxID=2175906 RepID=A0A8H6NEE6_9PEZI|nr:YidC/Oxa1 family membrane protein insertase [Colletotrichum plurivorum]